MTSGPGAAGGRPLKIGFACFRLDEEVVGGAEAYVSALAATLSRRGHDVRLLASTAASVAQPDRWRALWTGRFEPGAGVHPSGGLGVAPENLPCERLALARSQPRPRHARRLQRASEAEAREVLRSLAANAEAYFEAAESAWGPGPWVRLAPGWQLPEFSPEGASRWTAPEFGLWASAGNHAGSAVLRLWGSAPKPGIVRSDAGARHVPSGGFALDVPLSEKGLSIVRAPKFRPRGEPRTLGLFVNAAAVVDSSTGGVLAALDLGETFSNAELGAWPGEDPAAFLSRRPMPPRLGRLFDLARGPSCRGAKKAVRRLADECDLVVFAGLPFATVGWSRWAKGRAPAAVLPFRHAEDPYYAWEHYFRTLREADGVLLLTRAEGRGLEAGGNLHYVGGGFGGEIRPEFPSAEEKLAARARLGCEGEGPFVAMLGRKTPGKGWRLVQEAVKRLRAGAFPSARLLLAGPDEDRAPVDSETTLYLGKVSEKAKADLLLAADLFAFFSQSESFGLAVLEAWAGGCPAIAGDRCGAVAEVARTLGAPACPSSPDAIADAVAKELARPAQERALAWRQGAERLREEYSWEAVAERFEAFARAAVPSAKS